MRRRHRGAIQTFAIRGAMTAKTITSAVDARHFGMRNATNCQQQRGREDPSGTI
jgi:hypothetical protein